MKLYDIKVKAADGNEVPLESYKGKVLLIVNTASKCGFTPQYKDLEELYKRFGNEKFEILAFPCNQFMNQEPGNSEEIKNFCQLKYDVNFPLFEKIDVNGANAHPLYKYLCEAQPGLFSKSIKWNFTKFLIDSQGKIIGRYAPTTTPIKLQSKIEKLINEIK